MQYLMNISNLKLNRTFVMVTHMYLRFIIVTITDVSIINLISLKSKIYK